LGVEVGTDRWFRPLAPGVALAPGATTEDLLRIPDGDAQRLLRQTIRLVADIPRRSTPDVVWTQGASELLVRTGSIGLSCETGQVTVAVPVNCDQLGDGATIVVPIAVGTLRSPTGLVMSTLTRPAGPEIVIDAWSGALVAFAWEGLVHLAQALCAAIGKDGDGRPLVPAAIGAEKGVLLVQPAARHAPVGPKEGTS
jgi:hypothetical protein